MQTSSLIAIVLAYLVGSLSFAVIVSKAMGLNDPRSYGSGNPGATNVLRSGNKQAAIFTLLLDAFKGWLPVFIVQHWGSQWGLGATDVALVGLAAFLGHLYPVFFRFKGGKGVATAAGVLIALDPLLGLAVLGTWLFIAFAFRYSSLAAVLAAGLAPVYQVLMHGGNGQTLVVGILALALIGKHWQNIQRLMAGQESKIGSKKK